MKEKGIRNMEKGYKDEGQRKYVEGYGYMFQGDRLELEKPFIHLLNDI